MKAAVKHTLGSFSTGVVDWNPSGANILSIYKHGSAAAGPESLRCESVTFKTSWST